MFCSSYLPGQFFYISFFFLLSQNSFPQILWCLILFFLLFFWFFSDHFFFTRIPFISSDNSSNVDIPQASIFDHLVYSFPNSVSGIIIVGVPKIVILLNTSSTSLPTHPSGWLIHVMNGAHVLNCFSRVWLWPVALQAPLSMGFSRQEYWHGLPCPPPGDLPYLGIVSCIGSWVLYH